MTIHFHPFFHNAAYGYYIYEHNYGFVAVLDKRNVHRAYRDLDPVDLSPYILYAPTQDELIARIKESREHSSSQSLINFFDYKDVHLKEEHIRCAFGLHFNFGFGRRTIHLYAGAGGSVTEEETLCELFGVKKSQFFEYADK